MSFNTEELKNMSRQQIETAINEAVDKTAIIYGVFYPYNFAEEYHQDGYCVEVARYFCPKMTANYVPQGRLTITWN